MSLAIDVDRITAVLLLEVGGATALGKVASPSPLSPCVCRFHFPYFRIPHA